MKMSETMKKELAFLQAFSDLTMGKMKKGDSEETVLNAFKKAAKKLVKEDQISAMSLEMFLEEKTLDLQITAAAAESEKASKKLDKLKAKKRRISNAKLNDTGGSRVIDPCSHSRIRSSC